VQTDVLTKGNHNNNYYYYEDDDASRFCNAYMLTVGLTVGLTVVPTMNTKNRSSLMHDQILHGWDLTSCCYQILHRYVDTAMFPEGHLVLGHIEINNAKIGL
jgi:hypothetical protein